MTSLPGRITRVPGAIGRRLWSASPAYGLACDLEARPPERFEARIPVVMEVTDERDFPGFRRELDAGADEEEMQQRMRMCEEGVRSLYVARDPSGQPIYAQWLVDPSGQEALHRAAPGFFPHLEADETLVEGAYTFAAFRKQGAMRDGMGQLLDHAARGGSDRCLTYVGFGNVASLRGCASVGFDLDHIREVKMRLGRRIFSRRSPTQAERADWERAVRPSGG